jgi:hypothetical protein
MNADTKPAPRVAITAADFFAASPEQIREWFPKLDKAFSAVVTHIASDAAKAEESEAAA